MVVSNLDLTSDTPWPERGGKKEREGCNANARVKKRRKRIRRLWATLSRSGGNRERKRDLTAQRVIRKKGEGEGTYVGELGF